MRLGNLHQREIEPSSSALVFLRRNPIFRPWRDERSKLHRQILTNDLFVLFEFLHAALVVNPPLVDDVAPRGDLHGKSHVLLGQENRYTGLGDFLNQFTNLFDDYWGYPF